MKKLFSEIPELIGKRIVLRKLTDADANGLQALKNDQAVYRWLPTFLFERKYNDPHTVIRRLYDECLEESLILGVFMEGRFCGLAEMYGYRETVHKISVGYRLMESEWGKGIATEALELMVGEALMNRSIEIITASTMVENQASARVLLKNGFTRLPTPMYEDWGYEKPTLTDKWIRRIGIRR